MNKRYFFLLLILIMFAFVVTGFLIYRAHETDKFFEEVGSEISGQPDENVVR